MNDIVMKYFYFAVKKKRKKNVKFTYDKIVTFKKWNYFALQKY